MRLWHFQMIPFLPKSQLLSQHRECAALRGLGWGKKHSVVDYVFKHNYMVLYNYHRKVMQEMVYRKYQINDLNWYDPFYRGKTLSVVCYYQLPNNYVPCFLYDPYSEHDEIYLIECVKNLLAKIKNDDFFIYNIDDRKRFNQLLENIEYKERVDEAYD